MAAALKYSRSDEAGDHGEKYRENSVKHRIVERECMEVTLQTLALKLHRIGMLAQKLAVPEKVGVDDKRADRNVGGQ